MSSPPQPVSQGDLVSAIGRSQDLRGYEETHWSGSFAEYLDVVRTHPEVTRGAFQRIYDMILAAGSTEYYDSKKRIVHYHFFDDLEHGGRDAVFGLDISLMKMVNIFKSAARRYGTEKRVLLLHGPVGSSKSTIVRLLKKGLEAYSRRPEGALYTFSWIPDLDKPNDTVLCPMHAEPLHLIPDELRSAAVAALNEGRTGEVPVAIDGDLCPACRQQYREISLRHSGNWSEIVRHVRVRRIMLSEKDRIGIGTFQP